MLLVDDDKNLVEVSATFLEREIDDVVTTTLTDPTAVRPELQDGDYDCIVSDYDMPGQDEVNNLGRGGPRLL